MSAHTLRYVRITNSGRIGDRYVTTQVKEASDLEKRAFGRLFLIVELTNSWLPSSQIGQTIINTIAREYYKSGESDLLARFEGALKKVNETLDQLTRTSDQDLGDTLHAAVILQADDQLHIANTGGARAWLIRGGKGSPLLTPNKATSPPTKVFGSVLSGVLEPNDRVIVTSSGILSVLNDSELKTNIFAAGDFVATAIRLTNLLKAKRGQWVNALVLEYQDEASAANQPAHPLPDTLYLDAGSVGDWRLTASQMLAALASAAKQTRSAIAVAYRQASHVIQTKVVPHTKRLASSSQALASKGLADFQEKTLPSIRSGASSLKSQLQNATKQRTPEVVPDLDESASLIGKTVFAIHDYQGEPEIEPDELSEPNPNDRVRHYSAVPTNPVVEPAPEPVELKPLPTLPKFALPKFSIPPISLNLRSFKVPGKLGGQSLGFIAIVIVLLGLLINNLWALQNKRAEQLSRTQAAQRLTELQDKLQEAKLAKIFNQSEKALTAAQAVVDGSSDLVGSPLATDGTEIANEAQAVLDDLTGTTRLSNLTELAQIDGSRLALWQDRVTVAPTTGGLVTYPTSGGESASLSLPNGETVVGLAPFDGKDGFVLLSSGPSVYAATQGAGPLDPLSPSAGSWHAGAALTAFLSNLYTLSPAEKKIWKYTATSDSLSEGQSYIVDDTDVSSGIDIAIDGNVYVLTKTGEILKLNRGKRVELRVRDIPKPGETLSEPKQIVAAGDKLYVLDINRIVQLNNDGRYERQFALAGGEAIRAFAIKDKTLFMLTDTRLVKAEL